MARKASEGPRRAQGEPHKVLGATFTAFEGPNKAQEGPYRAQTPARDQGREQRGRAAQVVV